MGSVVLEGRLKIPDRHLHGGSKSVEEIASLAHSGDELPNALRSAVIDQEREGFVSCPVDQIGARSVERLRFTERIPGCVRQMSSGLLLIVVPDQLESGLRARPIGSETGHPLQEPDRNTELGPGGSGGRRLIQQAMRELMSEQLRHLGVAGAPERPGTR